MNDSAAMDSIPETIGKYRIKRKIDEGSMGIVYEGFDPFVQRAVAIKMSKSDSAVDERFQRSFFLEAHAAGRLQHPHIVSVFDAGMEGDRSYIVMEYVDGTTLQAYATPDSERLPIEGVIDVIFKCCKALDYAHREGVVHRDIKPSNIMFSKDREAKIMDFSIAIMGKLEDTQPLGVMGSPLYMSPEQVEDKSVGPQSDLYSLGAVMYQLLTGRPPFNAGSLNALMYKIVNEEAPLLSDARPDLPKSVSNIVEKALAKEPSRRFESGLEFGNVLSRQFNELRYAEQRIADEERRDMLADLSFFSDFAPEEIEDVVQATHWVHFNSGDVIIHEGDIDSSFFIIVTGMAEVIKDKRSLGWLYKGDCFGEIGFLTDQKRTATIYARSFLLLMKINASLMDQASRNTQLRYYKAFTAALINRLLVTNEHAGRFDEQ